MRVNAGQSQLFSTQSSYVGAGSCPIPIEDPNVSTIAEDKWASNPLPTTEPASGNAHRERPESTGQAGPTRQASTLR